MASLSEEHLKLFKFSNEEGATLRAIGEHRGRQELFIKQAPEALESLKQVAMIESSESSNRLEGITAPHKKIEALVLKKTMPGNRSEREIAGYRDALALVHESGLHMEFSTNVILQLHSLLYRYMPNDGGRWKMTDNEIVEKNPDGTIARVRFKPTPAVTTPFAMEELTKDYKYAIHNLQQEPLIIVPLAVLDFLCVHPFTDGNGRTARLLTLMLLYHFDYQVGKYISLERIFEESKEGYYETLQHSSQGWHENKHDAMPWLNYFWGTLLRAYKEFEARVGMIRAGRGSKTDQIIKAVDRRINPFSISAIEGDCPGVSRDMVRVILNRLRADGKLTLQGKGRAAKWKKKK
ncbi:MAG: Fic family protein [Deltaproteobacteria bacterium]|nr:Fic family protein [Deltaproteobacteria bacterium]